MSCCVTSSSFSTPFVCFLAKTEDGSFLSVLTKNERGYLDDDFREENCERFSQTAAVNDQTYQFYRYSVCSFVAAGTTWQTCFIPARRSQTNSNFPLAWVRKWKMVLYNDEDDDEYIRVPALADSSDLPICPQTPQLNNPKIKTNQRSPFMCCEAVNRSLRTHL